MNNNNVVRFISIQHIFAASQPSQRPSAQRNPPLGPESSLQGLLMPHCGKASIKIKMAALESFPLWLQKLSLKSLTPPADISCCRWKSGQSPGFCRAPPPGQCSRHSTPSSGCTEESVGGTAIRYLRPIETTKCFFLFHLLFCFFFFLFFVH